jgi:hypothetical protein
MEVIDMLLSRSILEATQSRRAGQINIPTNRSLQRWVVPELVVVIEVFPAHGETEDTLTKHRLEGVDNALATTRVTDSASEFSDDSGPLLGLAQQQCSAAVRCDVSTREAHIERASG